jgi:hypothetical protein
MCTQLGDGVDYMHSFTLKKCFLCPLGMKLAAKRRTGLSAEILGKKSVLKS